MPDAHRSMLCHAVLCSVLCLQVGAAVFQVLPKAESEEEALSAQAPTDEPGSTTRLVIPDDVISSSMIR